MTDTNTSGKGQDGNNSKETEEQRKNREGKSETEKPSHEQGDKQGEGSKNKEA